MSTRRTTTAGKAPEPRAANVIRHPAASTPVADQQQYQPRENKEQIQIPESCFAPPKARTRDPETECIIRNIPCNDDESQDYLEGIVHAIASIGNRRVDVHTCRRLKRKTDDPRQKPPPIVVKFNTRNAKSTFRTRYSTDLTVGMIASSLHRGTLYEPNTRIYIDENLTRKQSQLYFQARKFKKENGWKYCWTRDGKVYLRRSENERHCFAERVLDLFRDTNGMANPRKHADRKAQSNQDETDEKNQEMLEATKISEKPTTTAAKDSSSTSSGTAPQPHTDTRTQ